MGRLPGGLQRLLAHACDHLSGADDADPHARRRMRRRELRWLQKADAEGVEKVRVHVLMDGRDVPETSGLEYIGDLESLLHSLPTWDVD